MPKFDASRSLNRHHAGLLANLATLAVTIAGCQRTSPPSPESPEPSATEQTTATAALPQPKPPAGPHPFSIRDMLGLARLGTLVVSPADNALAFVVTRTDWATNGFKREIWVLDSLQAQPRRLAAGSTPAFSPDGTTLFFLAPAGESTQVWRIPVSGGEPQQVTRLPVSVANLRVSPKGQAVSFTAPMAPNCMTLACTAKALKRDPKGPSGQLYERIFVRHWDTWKDDRRSHLFVMPLSGEPVWITQGLDADVPSMPFGGRSEIAFAPDGRSIVFAARNAGAQNTEPRSTNFDLYQAPVDKPGQAQRLTTHPAWQTHPVFAPDGQTLMYASMERPNYEADRFRLVRRTWPQGSPEVVTEAWDRSVRDIAFTSDGQTLLLTAEDRGRLLVFSMAAQGGTPKALTDTGSAASPAVFQGRIVFLRHDLKRPTEVWSMTLDGQDRKALTQFNDALLKDARRGDTEQFTFNGFGGETVHAWLVKPANFNPEQRYPLAFLIHGGPQGSFRDSWSYRWNPQTYAGAGYAVVMVDFHGSTGYGQAFTDSINGDWGGKPLEDLKRGLDAALKRYRFIDGTRACALGASYGGYMINWIASQWPDRFRCLVNHDGVFDLRSMYYSTEELWFPEWEFGGPYFARTDAYEKHNPARFVSQWKTPMLVIHGSLDFRVPLEQGLAAFTALQRRGIESQLLHFPDENHWVLKPRNSHQWHTTVKAWLARHTR